MLSSPLLFCFRASLLKVLRVGNVLTTACSGPQVYRVTFSHAIDLGYRYVDNSILTAKHSIFSSACLTLTVPYFRHKFRHHEEGSSASEFPAGRGKDKDGG